MRLKRIHLFYPLLIMAFLAAGPAPSAGASARVGRPPIQTIYVKRDSNATTPVPVMQSPVSLPQDTNKDDDPELQYFIPQEQPSPGRSILQDTASPESPDAPEACTNLIKNNSFEDNTNWLTTVASNVHFITQSAYHGAQSLYMTTQNSRSPDLWQTVTLPAQANSMFIRFQRAAYIDDGESAFVELRDPTTGNRLWWAQIPATQAVWTEIYWWLPQTLAGRTVNVFFQMYPDWDQTHSDMYLDFVELAWCTDPPPTSTPQTRNFPLTISLYRPVPEGHPDREHYLQIIQYAADAIYEMSNGRHRLGPVTIYQTPKLPNVHVWWEYRQHPQADLNGYWYANNPNFKLEMGDCFPPAGSASGCSENHMQQWQRGGYTLAHEFGHFIYGMADEYQGKEWKSIPYWPLPGDTPVPYSVMTQQRNAIPGYDPSVKNGDHLKWLNFSIPYFNNRATNGQFRHYGASAWDTLKRHFNQDPPDAIRTAQTQRQYFPELAAVAPPTGYFPKHDIVPGAAHNAYATQLVQSIQWIPPASQAAADAVDYAAAVASMADGDVVYPQPAMVVASISDLGPIAKAGVQAQVTAPDGSHPALLLKDDGFPPDEIADDGQYSGIMPYHQNGNYQVSVAFNNASGQAAYTTIGQLDGPWSLGEPVGENFTAGATATITVQGFAADDHGDEFAGATEIDADNHPHPTRIDHSGDVDMFKIALRGDGLFILRMANFAEGIQPRVRFWASDQSTLLSEELNFTPEIGYYYYLRVIGQVGAVFYAEVSHSNPQVDRGSFELSIGRPLSGEADGFATFLPLAAR